MTDPPEPPVEPSDPKQKKVQFRSAKESKANLMRTVDAIARANASSKAQTAGGQIDPPPGGTPPEPTIEPPELPPGGPPPGPTDQQPKPPPQSNAAMWSAVAAIASLITALLAFILGILKLGDGEGRSGHQTSVVTGTSNDQNLWMSLGRAA